MVSVAMAVYNGENFIEQQLNSIKDQKVNADEVIICDDCSTDNSFEIIDSYIKRNKLQNWHVYKNEENLGYFKNFFKAILLCNGDTIYLADQDDKWNLNKIKECERLLKRPDISMVETNYVYIDKNNTRINIKNNYHNKIKEGDYVELTTKDICKFAGSGFTMAFKRDVKDVIYTNGLYEYSDIYEFHDVLIGLVSTCVGKCMLINHIYDEHRLHSHNVTESFNNNTFADRTKQFQIKLLSNRINRFGLIVPLQTDLTRRMVFERYRQFCIIRKDFIKTSKIKYLAQLIKYKDCYYEKKAIFIDILFAFNMEWTVRFILKKLRR